MLDLYAVDDLDPWPDDVPAGARHLGGLDPEAFAAVAGALRASGVDASYTEDWLVPADRVGALVAALHDAGPDAAALAAVLAPARGSGILAVAD
jgi:hypothetical protein